ncbi:hypothetical protein BC628DRAFT_1342391 [Trametes gibbosa]|nr:hypothetical protein BC628DRAFT_1342391 [Trametes gibbosa]
MLLLNTGHLHYGWVGTLTAALVIELGELLRWVIQHPTECGRKQVNKCINLKVISRKCGLQQLTVKTVLRGVPSEFGLWWDQSYGVGLQSRRSHKCLQFKRVGGSSGEKRRMSKKSSQSGVQVRWNWSLGSDVEQAEGSYSCGDRCKDNECNEISELRNVVQPVEFGIGAEMNRVGKYSMKTIRLLLCAPGRLKTKQLVISLIPEYAEKIGVGMVVTVPPPWARTHESCSMMSEGTVRRRNVRRETKKVFGVRVEGRGQSWDISLGLRVSVSFPTFIISTTFTPTLFIMSAPSSAIALSSDSEEECELACQLEEKHNAKAARKAAQAVEAACKAKEEQVAAEKVEQEKRVAEKAEEERKTPCDACNAAGTECLFQCGNRTSSCIACQEERKKPCLGARGLPDDLQQRVS